MRTFRQTVVHRLRMARHNIIAHPIAGICWLVGWEKVGDWFHNNW